MSQQSLNERLNEELTQLQNTNKKSQMLYGILVVILGGYLGWAYSQLSILLNPEGMAEAATGMAIDQIPLVSQSLQDSIKESAPDLARTASDNIAEVIPMYRLRLESETKPVIDEVTGILADVAVRKLVAASDAGNSPFAKSEAINSASVAVVNELDTVLNDAMDTPSEEGVTPRQSIESSLSQLRSIDNKLNELHNGGGDPKERELLLTWINVLTQAQADSDAIQ